MALMDYMAACHHWHPGRCLVTIPCVELVSAVTVTQPVLVHWDLWDGNIFIDPETKEITGILDFERALWGDPLMEINFGAFGSNLALIEGYGSDLLAASNAKIRRILYNIYLWLIMIIECTYRQYETKDQENWIRPKLVEEFEKLEALSI